MTKLFNAQRASGNALFGAQDFQAPAYVRNRGYARMLLRLAGVITVAATQAPNTPAGLANGTPAATSVPYTWTASAVDGTHDAATTYQLSVSLSGAGSYTNNGAPVSGTSATLTGLTASTAYDVRIQATNAGGTSGYGTDTVTTAAATTGSATPFTVVRTGLSYATLQGAYNTVISTDTITVAPGTYTVANTTDIGSTYLASGVLVDTLTIEAADLSDKPVLDLSAFITGWATAGGGPIGILAGSTNRHLTVRGLVLIGSPVGYSYGINSDAGYPSGNPAADLTIEYCHLEGWSDAVKNTYANSNFATRLRYSTIKDFGQDSLTHGIYITGNTLEVTGCTFTYSAGYFMPQIYRGHNIKSRCRTTTVRGCLFDPVGGCATNIELPNGGALVAEGNIILHYGATSHSDENPPIKHGAEQNQPFFVLSPVGGALSVGNVVTALETGYSFTITAAPGSNTYYYTLGGLQQYPEPGNTIQLSGVTRGTISTKGGSPDGVLNDGRTHSVKLAQNTIRKLQSSWNPGDTANSYGAIEFKPMTTVDGTAITVATVKAASTVRNNILAGEPLGAKTMADFPDNTAVAYSTVTALGVYSGGVIAGSPAINDAPYSYAGLLTIPTARTDTNRGGLTSVTAGIPAWVPSTAWAWTDIAATTFTNYMKSDGTGIAPAQTSDPVQSAEYFRQWDFGATAYSPKFKQLYLFGGGHTSTSINMVSRWNLGQTTPDMSVACQPTSLAIRTAEYADDATYGANPTHSDGRPKAPHSYRNVQAIDTVDALVTIGLAAINSATVGQVSNNRILGLQNGASNWSASTYWPMSGAGGSGVEQLCFHSYDRSAVYYSSPLGDLKLYKLTGSTRTVAAVSSASIDWSGYALGADDGTGRALVVGGQSASTGYRARFIDLTTGVATAITVSGYAWPSGTTGYAGLVWVPSISKFVAHIIEDGGYGNSNHTVTSQVLVSLAPTGSNTMTAALISTTGTAQTSVYAAQTLHYDADYNCLIVAASPANNLQVIKVS